jgi:putative zinc finger/helix-turn-helix YgiT family protein
MQRPYPWKCPKCGERKVNPVLVDYSDVMEHDGRSYTVAVNGLEILRCEGCGNEMLPDESYEKLAEAMRFQAELLTPNQIAEKRKELGLNQKEFASLLGVAAETVSRWETGGQIQQRVMNDFMCAVFDLPELKEYLMQKRGISLPSVVKRQQSNASPKEVEIAKSI